jgi:hypothetical protein
MARQSWELLDWPHLCRCLLFARPITFAAREAQSFAREHAWLGGIDFGYGHPFDELIYLPAAE